jgi:hypothetical protein
LPLDRNFIYDILQVVLKKIPPNKEERRYIMKRFLTWIAIGAIFVGLLFSLIASRDQVRKAREETRRWKYTAVLLACHLYRGKEDMTISAIAQECDSTYKKVSRLKLVSPHHKGNSTSLEMEIAYLIYSPSSGLRRLIHDLGLPLKY